MFSELRVYLGNIFSVYYSEINNCFFFFFFIGNITKDTQNGMYCYIFYLEIVK